MNIKKFTYILDCLYNVTKDAYLVFKVDVDVI